MLGLVLFNTFFNDLEDEIKCTFQKCPDDTKLGEVTDQGCQPKEKKITDSL